MTKGDLVLTPRGLLFQGRCLPCTVGRGGVTGHKAEGDGATPAGTHRIVAMLYRPDRIMRPAPWARIIRRDDLWCDESGHPAYNQLVRAPFTANHEALHRADALYDLVLVTDWNWPVAQAGRGSAIFLHQWRRPGYPTAGCIAMARRDLHWMAARLTQGARLVVPNSIPRYGIRRSSHAHQI